MKPIRLATLLVASTALSYAALAQQAPADNAQVPTYQRSDTAPVGTTVSPTDIGHIRAGNSVTPGGVNRVDLGGGNMIEEDAPKSRSTVTRDAIDKLSPTSNPYQMLNLLPGANVMSTDAAGLNGGNITLRGFQSSQIGLTIEGMPVNDSGNYALYPQEYVDAENIQEISIAQGSSDLDSPHIGATGGVINIYMIDPSKTASSLADFSVGLHDTTREFARLETGQIGSFRALISASHYEDNHWAGPGRDWRNNFEGKAVYDLSAASRITFSFLYNAEANNFYPNPTLAQFNTPGYKPEYLATLPSTFFTGPDQSANSASNYYKFKINPFVNVIASAPSTFALADRLTFDVIPYVWYGFGNGGGVSTLAEQPLGTTSGSGVFYGNTRLTGIDWNGNGVVVAGQKALYYNPSVTLTWRPGVINKLTYDLDDNKIVLGYWFEDARHRQTAPYEALSASGDVQDPFLFTSGAFIIPNGIYAGKELERRDWLTKTMTNEVFAGDTWSLMDGRVILEAGVKQVFVDRTLYNYIPGATPQVSADNSQTLPSLGATVKLDDTNSIFGSIATSFRTTPNYALADVFSTSTGQPTTTANSGLKPEQAITLELGHRYQGPQFATSVTGFITQYSNRQVTTNEIDPGTTSYISVNLNAGSVTTYGIDAEAGTRPVLGGFRPYISGELLHTELHDNLPTTNSANGADFLPTKGKQLPASPEMIGALGIDYDNGNLFGNLAVKYIGKQYSTFVNDESIPGFTRTDFTIGYRFDHIAMVKAPELKLDIGNLFNARQLTGVNSIQTNAKTTTGTNGGTISGTAPSYYMGQGFSAILTLRAAL